MTTRVRVAVLSALVGLVGVWIPAATAGRDHLRLAVQPLAPGVQHEMWRRPGSPALIHVARVSPQADVRLEVVQARGGLAAGRETTSSLCARTPNCLVAVNGDFFTADGPVGAVISGGRLLRTPVPGHEQLSLAPLAATGPGLGVAGWSGALVTPDGRRVVLAGVNVPLEADGPVLYTSAFGPQTPECACTELVLHGAAAGQIGRPDSTPRLAVRGSGHGLTPLAPDVVVLAARDQSGRQLEELASRRGLRVGVSLQLAAPSRANVGAHPIMLRDGAPTAYDEADPMLAEPGPRTAVAWTDDGRLWLVTIDGRQARDPGLTAVEALDFLRHHLGAEDAAFLDGGGSTSFAVGDRVVNRPSDGAERPVSNAVVVIALPEPAPAVVSTPAPVSQSMSGRPVLVGVPATRAPARPAARAVAPVRSVQRPAAPAAAPRPLPPVPRRGPPYEPGDDARRPQATADAAEPMHPPSPWPPRAAAILALLAACWLQAAARTGAGGNPRRRE